MPTTKHTAPTPAQYHEYDEQGNPIHSGGYALLDAGPNLGRYVKGAALLLALVFLYQEGPSFLTQAATTPVLAAAPPAYAYTGPAQDRPLAPLSMGESEDVLGPGPVPVRERARLAGKENSVLWVARLLVSESPRPAEWPAIGGVARNRVKSGRFPDYYKSVVLQPRQFSAFNRTMPRSRRYYTTIGWDGRSTAYPARGKHRLWDQALEAAYHIVVAEDGPLVGDAFHFYHRDALTVPGPAGNRHARSGCRRLGGVPHPDWMHRPTARVVKTHRDLVVVAGL